MFEPLEVKALSDYRIWIRYADGEEGEVDVSHLAGQGVFELWEDESKWKNVQIAEDGAIRWSEGVYSGIVETRYREGVLPRCR